MTAASGAEQPTLRDQLAEALMDAKLIRWREPELVREFVDLLLPLIEADRERAKAEGGADALERLAMIAKPASGLLGEITRRAASLRATTGQPPDGTPVP